MPAVFDIGAGGIPSKDAPPLIPQRIVPDQKPAILSVFSLDSCLQFKRGRLKRARLRTASNFF